MPALIQIVNEKIEIIVEFKFLNPDAILKMIDKDLNMNKLMFQIDSDAEDKPVMKESFMTFVFLIGLFFMLFVIAFLVLNFSKKFKKQRQILIDLVLSALVWNGVFQSLTFGYLS